MTQLGNGLYQTKQYEDALSVQEAELSIARRTGASAHNMLAVQTNLAITYTQMGRREEALQVDRDVYCGRVRLNGEEHNQTLVAANNYASILNELKRFEEAKALLRKILPVARRVSGDSTDFTLKMRWIYAEALYSADGATLDDFREAVTTLEDTERTARRVLGGAHPLVAGIENSLRIARTGLAAQEVSARLAEAELELEGSLAAHARLLELAANLKLGEAGDESSGSA